MHNDDPLSWEYFPGEHSVHETELLTTEKLPELHRIQLPSFVVLYVPGRQSFMGKQNVDPLPIVVQSSKHEIQLEEPAVTIECD